MVVVGGGKVGGGGGGRSWLVAVGGGIRAQLQMEMDCKYSCDIYCKLFVIFHHKVTKSTKGHAWGLKAHL
jgi:hypothetical protein